MDTLAKPHYYERKDRAKTHGPQETQKTFRISRERSLKEGEIRHEKLQISSYHRFTPPRPLSALKHMFMGLGITSSEPEIARTFQLDFSKHASVFNGIGDFSKKVLAIKKRVIWRAGQFAGSSG